MKFVFHNHQAENRVEKNSRELAAPIMMSNAHGFEFYDDTWQLIPPDYGATEYE